MAGLTVQPPVKGVEVVHAIPGRVRLRANGAAAEASLKVVENHLQQGIYQININPHTGSAVIAFNERKICLEQLLDQLQSLGVRTGHSCQKPPLSEPLEVVSAAFSSVQLDTAIPLMVGVLLTQRLGVTGLPVLPLYLIAASTTRQVIEECRTIAPRVIARQETTATANRHPAIDIIHAVPGRVRFHIPQLADNGCANRIQRLTQRVAGVSDVRINHNRAYMVVSYNRRVATPDQMQTRLMAAIADAIAQPTHRPKVEERPLKLVQPSPKSEPVPELSSTSVTATGKLTTAVSNPRKNPQILPDLLPEKNSFWGQYKPPALSVFLAFMANLY